MANSKIETFIGFCIKSSKMTYGSGAISTLRQGVRLIILDGSCAKNSKRLALKYSNRFSCPLVICKTEFERIVNKEGCKMCAVRDGELARAILENLDDNYELYAGGSI